MGKSKGTTLGKTAVQQVGDMVRQWSREDAGQPQSTARQPVHAPDWGRWGTLQADLFGGTTTPVLASWVYFQRNDAESGSRGAWVPVVDADGQQRTFLVIEGGLYPSSKKLPAGTKVHCEQVASDLWAPDAAFGCPV